MNLAYFEKRQLAISGYRGFIGSNLTNLIPEEYTLVHLDDLGNYPINYLIHLASRVSDDSKHLMENISTDINIFETCQENNINLVYASTNNVYPLSNDCEVRDKVDPLDMYPFAKNISEKLIHNNYDIKHHILRLGDVFGKNQRHGNFFKSIQSSLENKKPLQLFGEGKKLRSYIYVEDLVRLLDYLVSKDNQQESGIFNVCYSEKMDLRDILDYISSRFEIEVARNEYNEEDTTERTMVPSEIKGFNNGFSLKGSLIAYTERCLK